MGPMFLEAVRPHSKLHFDAHLMIENPGALLDEFIDAGANSVSVHAEGNPHLHRLVSRIQEKGVMAGVVLNPATPTNVLEAILPQLDYVLVMSVDPGFSGQKFLPLALEKIKLLKEWRERENLDFLIQVDGGVNPQTVSSVAQEGADVLVCGSGLLSTKQSLRQNVADLRAAMDN